MTFAWRGVEEVFTVVGGLELHERDGPHAHVDNEFDQSADAALSAKHRRHVVTNQCG